LLSLKKKYNEKPENLQDIKIPLKNEIRSRARILTDEAFRETRNYLNLDSEILDNSNNLNSFKFISKDKQNLAECNAIDKFTMEIREILNKISIDNFDSCRNNILKINYDQFSLEKLKVINKNFKFLGNLVFEDS